MVGSHVGRAHNLPPQAMHAIRSANITLHASVCAFALSLLLACYNREDLKYAVRAMYVINFVSMVITGIIVFRAYRIVELMNRRGEI